MELESRHPSHLRQVEIPLQVDCDKCDSELLCTVNQLYLSALTSKNALHEKIPFRIVAIQQVRNAVRER
jgi:hypothetical protein